MIEETKITEHLRQLKRIDTEIDSLCQSEYTEINSMNTRAADLQAQIASKREPFLEDIAKHESAIQTLAPVVQKTVKTTYGSMSFRKAHIRTSWDTKALESYADTHPEIQTFKKITNIESSTTIKII